MNISNVGTPSTYDVIAAEYYDSDRHPTCANFGELSTKFLHPNIIKYLRLATRVLEVGAGRSVVAPIMAAQMLPLTNLTLLDKSPAMLEHSRKWKRQGAVFLIRDARDTGLAAGSIQLIVSSLGDPYNDPEFWQEVRRLLDDNGICLFTIPAPEWAERFRAGSDSKTADFFLKNGRTVLARSFIPPRQQQATMITDAGLHILEVKDLSAELLSIPRSPKLKLSPETLHLPIVRGYVISKTSSSASHKRSTVSATFRILNYLI
jgi:SAM-dependent methyltransferase